MDSSPPVLVPLPDVTEIPGVEQEKTPLTSSKSKKRVRKDTSIKGTEVKHDSEKASKRRKVSVLTKDDKNKDVPDVWSDTDGETDGEDVVSHGAKVSKKLM